MSPFTIVENLSACGYGFTCLIPRIPGVSVVVLGLTLLYSNGVITKDTQNSMPKNPTHSKGNRFFRNSFSKFQLTDALNHLVRIMASRIGFRLD